MPTNIQVKSILNKTKARDPWFLDDYTLNPYSGCSFNCLFCYIRGSKYGFNMAEKVSVKINAPDLLEKKLALLTKQNKYGIILIASATDPYLHFEKETTLTKQLLEIILHYKFPVHIITRSDLILRDFPILHKINETAILPKDLQDKLTSKVIITFSFSTLEERIAQIFEPGATSPLHRLEAIKACVQENFLTGVSMMPMLPYITDTGENLEMMIKSFKDAGANYIFPATLTLFGEGSADSKTLVLRAISTYYPHLKDKYEKLFRGDHQLPDYYRNAFDIKMKELLTKYNIRNTII